MTTKDSQTLEFIKLFQRTNRVTPSLYDISEYFKIAKTASQKRVQRLVKLGELKKDKNGRIVFHEDIFQ